MKFNEILNKYLDELNCTSKTLSNVSGISNSVISRYRNGQRVPSCDSTQVVSIANAIEKISNGKYNGKDVLKQFNNCINKEDSFDYSSFSKNLKEIGECLHINTNDMAKYIIFDPSHISRIKAGKTRPSDPIDFTKKVSSYIVYKFNDNISKKELSLLLKCNIEDLNEKTNFFNLVFKWLSKSTEENNDDKIEKFLNNMDNFDLNDYIKAIKFDELKIPFVPFYHIKNKNYYGLEEMKKGELDFFKAVVLSKNKDDVFMCSDMPMEDMAKDVDFGKKWMFAIALCLKKGLHLNVIHNLDRPFNEMMLGLESWIPIYMTGQVSPYYLKGIPNSTYCHFNYVSGTVALTGECISGYHNEGKYSLINNKNEVAYYKTKADCLLKKATPLMEIYRAESKNAFTAFISSSAKHNGNRRRILSSLPIHTISDELLLKILKRNKVSDENIEIIKSAVQEQKDIISTILKTNKFEDEISKISKEDFDKSPLTLSLSNSFYEKRIYYNYDEYLEHLELTNEYEEILENNKNYTLTNNPNHTFRNIQISICENQWVMVSKDTSPSIHFVIHHPKLRNAIENFIPPIVE